MTKVISQAGLTKLIQLIKDGFLSKSNTVDANTILSGYVPTSRTVNGKALSSNISLSASDVGALPDSTVIPTVNNATLTIQKNGTTVKTFTANASTDVTANITVPTKVSDLTNDSGFITGITSSDVTTALGYTPYNSSNPSGYQANVIETIKVNGTALTPSSKAVDVIVPTESTVSGWGFTKNAGTVTSVNNVSPVSGNVTLSIPTVTDTYSATSSDAMSGKAVASAISGKQDTLVSGTSIKTINSTSLLGSGNIAVQSVIDSNNKLDYAYLSNTPTIPTVNNATLTITQGGTTKGTFTANASSDVTIDLDSGGSSILEALYPVGSIYITTANTCPLSTLISGSTWTQETCRQLVKKKIPTNDDPNWYNLYSDGWCEQGGSLSNNSSGAKDIVFLKSFSNNNYYLSCSSTYSSNGATDHQESMNEFVSRSTTGFRKYFWVNTNNLWWKACGYTSTTTSHKQFRRTA